VHLCLKWRWDDFRRRTELLVAMKDDAARVTMDIPIFEGTFEEVLQQYEGRFITTAGSELATTEFREARQTSDEDILRFHARVRELYIRAYPSEPLEGTGLAGELRRVFIWGLTDERISIYIWDRRPGTYFQCLQLAQEKYSTIKIAKVERSKASRIASMGENQRNSEQRDETEDAQRVGAIPNANQRLPAGGSGVQREMKCYVCQSPSHLWRQCPFYQKMMDLQSGGATANNVSNVNKKKETKKPNQRKRQPSKGRRVAAMNQEGSTTTGNTSQESSGNEDGAVL